MEVTVAVLIKQELEGVTQATYDAVQGRLNAEADPPAGLIVHTSGPVDGGWRIVDVWESAEDFQRFAAERIRPAVMAFAEEAGIEPVEPQLTVRELYDVISP
jgi:hypothetical protein